MEISDLIDGIVKTPRSIVHEKLVRLGVGSPTLVDVGAGIDLATFDATVDHREIEVTVVLDVQEGCPETGVWQARGDETGGRCAVVEAETGVVRIKRVALVHQVGYEQIEVTVAVRVARGNSHTCFGVTHRVEPHAGEERSIDEASVTVVFPQLITH